MSTGERTGSRFDEFSMWHRKNSIKRFDERGKWWRMIDLDYIEQRKLYIHGREEFVPLVLYEVTKNYKTDKTNVISTMRFMTKYLPVSLPFVLIRFNLTKENLAEEYQTLDRVVKQPLDIKDINNFHVSMYKFKEQDDPVFEDKEIQPKEFAGFIGDLRDEVEKNWREYLEI